MSITYPRTMPSTPTPTRVTLHGVSGSVVSVSPFSHAQQVQKWPGEHWEAGVTLPLMTRAQAEPWLAWLLSLRGQYGTFYLGDPAGATARGPASGTPVVGGGGQTGESLNTYGWTASTTVLLEGDYISLGSGATTRLHKVLADVTSDAGGLAAIDIFPRLRESPAADSAVGVSSCKGVFRLAKSEVLWDVSPKKLYAVSFEAVEMF